MSDIAVRARGLGKSYRLGARPERYRMLRETIMRGASALLRRRREDRRETLWALRDVSFEIPRGDVVGVIGRNGAGKSTLLKVLSRITEPTEGFAEIAGRVGALLEVGTGFHLELTGRENIFLNGAILGMRRGEIRRKFDEIVAFAEVERFLDTPVKHYSSGMHLRLAFAVAAHLEPEILLVDEVLAVGDASFQKKCMGKMEDVAHAGRTVLFVSHNLGAVRELCRSSLVLEGGRLAFQGPVVEGLACYGRIVSGAEGGIEGARGTGWRAVALKDASGAPLAGISPGIRFRAEATLDLQEPCSAGRLFCILSDAAGNVVVHQRVRQEEAGIGRLEPGSWRVAVDFPALWLAPGVYTLHFKFMQEGVEVASGRHQSERVLLDVSGAGDGVGRALLAPAARWQIEPAAEAAPVA